MKKKDYIKLIKTYVYILIPVTLLCFEIYGLIIDGYNFVQRNKIIKIINENKISDNLTLSDLWDFNIAYKADISPIKNCYYFTNRSETQSYMFWFKLESKILRTFYGTEYYAYPKYDLPYQEFCPALYWSCSDGNKDTFKYVISRPCN